MFLTSIKMNFHKLHYPFFLMKDYTPLSFAPYYAEKALKLAIDRPNFNQIAPQRLSNFLIDQIEEDKTIFVKQKQILFVGRSNSGKSTLINKVFRSGKTKIARVAKKAGTTKFLHMHHVQKGGVVVDAPGYGFAKMNVHRRLMWFGLTEEYIKISSRLSQIFLCINFQHGLKPNDRLFLQRVSAFNVGVQVICTKCDKVSKKKFQFHLKAICEELKRMEIKCLDQRVIVVSSKDNFGLEIVQMRIVEALEWSEQRNIDQKEDLLLQYLKEMRVTPTKIEQKLQQQSKQYIVRKLIYNSKLSKFLM